MGCWNGQALNCESKKKGALGDSRAPFFAHTISRSSNSRINNLGYLTSCGIVTWEEGTVRIARYNRMVESGFDVGIEGLGRGYIGEVRASCGIYHPTLGTYYYL